MRPLVRSRALLRWKGVVLAVLSISSLTLAEGRHDRHAGRVGRPSAPLSAGERRARVLDAFSRVRAVRSCWQRQLLRDPTTPSRVLQVSLHVDAAGVTREARVRDPMAPDLARCISLGALSIAPVGAGDAFVAVTTVQLDRGE